jgi:hypothetical protein
MTQDDVRYMMFVVAAVLILTVVGTVIFLESLG